MKLASLFSGGKDSMYSIYKAKLMGYDIVCLVTASPKSFDSQLLHFPTIELTKLQAKAIIHTLQLHFDVYTDQELADKLHSTRSAISQWKVYNRIPKKILTKYGHIISGAEKKEKPQTKSKGSRMSIDHYEKLIDLQDEKISELKKEIDKL